VRVADVAECYEKHADALVRFAASQVGWADADDVVSAAVLGVLGGSGEPDDLTAYLYRSVANACHSHWRTVERRSKRETAFSFAAGHGGPPDDERVDVLLAGLARLSPQQRAIVHLTYWEDLTPATIGARLGVSEGTVRRQLARARDRLRRLP
jgi:RNA polymerase sigma-70 factor, ECF subfamily